MPTVEVIDYPEELERIARAALARKNTGDVISAMDARILLEAAEKLKGKVVPTFSADEAFDKMNRGVWMTCPGFTLRNLDGEHMLTTIRHLSHVWWERFDANSKIQWPGTLGHALGKLPGFRQLPKSSDRL